MQRALVQPNDRAERKACMLALELTFIAAVITVAHFQVVPPWTILIMGVFAVRRAANTISFNEVAEFMREPFCEVVPDSCGAGKNVEPRKNAAGVVYVLAALIACPICSATWVALILYSLYCLHPQIGTAMILVLGLAGAAETLHYGNEWLSWNARLARVQAGKLSPDREKL